MPVEAEPVKAHDLSYIRVYLYTLFKQQALTISCENYNFEYTLNQTRTLPCARMHEFALCEAKLHINAVAVGISHVEHSFFERASMLLQPI